MTQATSNNTPPFPIRADFKGLQDWIEVFRAGTHVDSKGKQHTFRQADLDEMVANVALGKPPAVLGHPKHDDPAYGWAELKRDGDTLFAKFSDVNPAFEAGVASGAYRNRSVAVLPDKDKGWRVRHIGWLGAMPPAIDGLKPVEFAADEEAEVIEFAAADDALRELTWALDSFSRVARGFRDYVIEKDGIEAADRVAPTYLIESMQSAAVSVRAALNRADQPRSAFSTPTGGDMAFTQEDIDRAREEARQQAAAQFAAQGQELAELRATRVEEGVATKVNAWKAAGLVLPAEEAGLRAFMVTLENQASEFTFSAPDKQEVKQTPAQWFAAFMAGRKPLINLGRDQRLDAVVDDKTSDDPAVIAQRATEYMAEQSGKGVTVSLAEAVSKFSPPQA